MPTERASPGWIACRRCQAPRCGESHPFVTTDRGRALGHYRRLGFSVEAYDDADFYGYACRDAIEIHIARVDHLDCRTTMSCAYLWVDDADALHAEWAAAGVEGRLQPPRTTEYGLHEGAHVDPDANLIRFAPRTTSPGSGPWRRSHP